MLVENADGGLVLRPDVNPTAAPHFLRETGETYWRVARALASLEKEARVYCSAVGLIQYASMHEGRFFEGRRARGLPGAGTRTVWSDWAGMAGRQAALAAHNLQESLSSLQSSLRDFPACDEINVAELRDVRRALASLFPDARNLRDAVAHPEFFYRDNVDTTDGPRGIQWGPGIFGNEFVASLRGRQQKCLLTEAAAREVCIIVDRVLTVFEPVCRRKNSTFDDWS